MAKVSLIRKSIKPQNKIEKIKLFVSLYSLLMGIKITDTEILILAAFLTEGVSRATKDELLRVRLLKNENCLNNTLSKMRSKGILIKEGLKKEDAVADVFKMNYENKLRWELEIE